MLGSKILKQADFIQIESIKAFVCFKNKLISQMSIESSLEKHEIQLLTINLVATI